MLATRIVNPAFRYVPLLLILSTLCAAQAPRPEPVTDQELAIAIFPRILAVLINAAVDALFWQVATREDIDLAMTKGVNYVLQHSFRKGAFDSTEMTESIVEVVHRRCTSYFPAQK